MQWVFVNTHKCMYDCMRVNACMYAHTSDIKQVYITIIQLTLKVGEINMCLIVTESSVTAPLHRLVSSVLIKYVHIAFT